MPPAAAERAAREAAKRAAEGREEAQERQALGAAAVEHATLVKHFPEHFMHNLQHTVVEPMLHQAQGSLSIFPEPKKPAFKRKYKGFWGTLFRKGPGPAIDQITDFRNKGLIAHWRNRRSYNRDLRIRERFGLEGKLQQQLEQLKRALQAELAKMQQLVGNGTIRPDNAPHYQEKFLKAANEAFKEFDKERIAAWSEYREQLIEKGVIKKSRVARHTKWEPPYAK